MIVKAFGKLGLSGYKTLVRSRSKNTQKKWKVRRNNQLSGGQLFRLSPERRGKLMRVQAQYATVFHFVSRLKNVPRLNLDFRIVY